MERQYEERRKIGYKDLEPGKTYQTERGEVFRYIEREINKGTKEGEKKVDRYLHFMGGEMIHLDNFREPLFFKKKDEISGLERKLN